MSTIGEGFLLKVTAADKDGNFGDVLNDDHWSGSDDLLRFFTVLDGDTTDGINPFFAIVASSSNENPSVNNDFRVKFGIDVNGAKAEQHSAEVIFELAIL